MTLEVYGDFQCPICARHSLTVEPLLVSQYAANGTLRIVHHDIAILSSTADGESERAARGGYCATQQGKYWDYAHWVFNNQSGENQGGFARDRLVAIAGAAGLDQRRSATASTRRKPPPPWRRPRARRPAWASTRRRRWRSTARCSPRA